MSSISGDPAAEPIVDRDSAYRQYIAETILKYATQGGLLDNIEAHREVMAATQRTLGTVKNWLAYRVNFPDVASIARIVQKWKIPPEMIFPPELEFLLAGLPRDPAKGESQAGAGQMQGDQLLISLQGAGDPLLVDRALSKYTDNPKSAILVRQEGSEMLDQIRPGELMLVDPTWEQIRSSGMYFLKFSAEGEADKTCVRMVEILMGQPAVRLSCGSAMPPGSSETLPLVHGNLPAHISVHGRVVAVLRQT